MTYNPWAELRSLPGIHLVFEDLGDCWGYYDEPTNTIHLDTKLNQAERRCTLAHELEHAKAGDEALPEGWLDTKRERVTNLRAARRLIPLEALADILCWAPDEHVIADALWVDVDTVRVRLDRLTSDERDYIAASIARKEVSA